MSAACIQQMLNPCKPREEQNKFIYFLFRYTAYILKQYKRQNLQSLSVKTTHKNIMLRKHNVRRA